MRHTDILFFTLVDTVYTVSPVYVVGKHPKSISVCLIYISGHCVTQCRLCT